MPRVLTRTKAARGRDYSCARCGEKIETGQSFYYWTRRFGRSGVTYRQHHTCGYPRPTQLSSRKTAQIEEVLNDTSIALEFTFPDDIDFDSEHLRQEHGGSFDIDTADLDSAAEDIAASADEVADEYESSADNMPENLQYGSQAEAMRAVAEELREWAESLRNYASSCETTVEVPDPADHATAEAWREAIERDGEEKVAGLVAALEDLTGSMPEYQG